MARFFHLLYYYLLGFFVLFVIYMVTMLVLSPKQDLQKRGFIPCTEQFVLNVAECNRGEMVCPLKYLWQDTMCNASVILEGFGSWIKGKQNAPWSNYIFSAEKYEKMEYNGDVAADMADLEAQSQFTKRKIEELEAAKAHSLNLREDVLLSSPENLFDGEKIEKNEPVIEEKNTGDISDEAFMEEINMDEEHKENDK